MRPKFFSGDPDQKLSVWDALPCPSDVNAASFIPAALSSRRILMFKVRRVLKEVSRYGIGLAPVKLVTGPCCRMLRASLRQKRQRKKDAIRGAGPDSCPRLGVPVDCPSATRGCIRPALPRGVQARRISLTLPSQFLHI